MSVDDGFFEDTVEVTPPSIMMVSVGGVGWSG